MPTLHPHLWFSNQATAAAKCYVDLFPNSSLGQDQDFSDTPSGDVVVLSPTIMGLPMQFLQADNTFVLNPSASFMVNCHTKEEFHRYWDELVKDGSIMMEAGEYSWSPLYGWLEDRFGVSWQIMLDTESESSLTPSLLFTGDATGKAKQALDLYTSVIPNSSLGALSFYPDDVEKLQYGEATIAGMRLNVMDSNNEHEFVFNEAFSLVLSVDTQEEIDHFWEVLGENGEYQECGWLKDQFGVSWQVVPKLLEELVTKGTPEQAHAVTQAFLKMKKFDIAGLEAAYHDAN